jgi:hypothetical protein
VRSLHAAIYGFVWFAAATAVAAAAWRPPNLHPSQATLSDVLAANVRAAGGDDPHLAQRHEHWTYLTGRHRLSVDVAVRNADFRTTLVLDGLTYMAGRQTGTHWRGDGNGIVHGIEADLQGDALDRPPQAVFPLDAATCTLAGEATIPLPAWVIETHPDGDKSAFLYVDEASGTIVREVMRDGKRVVTTTFDRFAPIDGAQRARHWQISDGNAANALDVTVDSIEPGPVADSELAFPARRLFTTPEPLTESVTLDSAFRANVIALKVNVNGTPAWFDLDTGTTSITVDPQIAKRNGGATLEHAAIAKLSVGPLELDNASVLTVPFPDTGLLGYDFFFGHVIEIDYHHRRVRVLSPADATAAFADPKTATVTANVDQGLPLVAGRLGPATSNAFAVDTGSQRLYVMAPFIARYAAEIAAHWTPEGRPFFEHFLEGSIELQPYRVARFALADATATDVLVGAQIPSARADDLEVPFDGIIGTDVLQYFDLIVDYENARLGLRS